MAERLGVYLYN
ncbi:hypothetical protein S7711_10205 [Stachybotrys chartarum IBT 7711]|uniref:Uncharacterized protein n=1 Tax=Stachybotrys chartarum (strain CBS 109288 / IBT 7711) TaxID=1280523 RepID=A0A084BCC4_STACB|nr:hypothetical protein S7711_10205 [Stachybotrys chartarum IBT 7711]